MSKICTKCKRELGLACFSINRASKDGLQYWCKKCVNACMVANRASKPFHNSWGHMLARCYKPSNPHFKNYGGRGITVCTDWRNSYEAYKDFRLSLGDSMDSPLSLDRINNDGNYEPSNCQLATHQDQQLNKRKCKPRSTNPQSVHKNVSWNKPTSRWVAQVRRDGKLVHLGYFTDDAVAHQAVLAHLAAFDLSS